MATAATEHPLVTVQSLDGNMTTDQTQAVPLPNVIKVSIQPDIATFIHLYFILFFLYTKTL